MKLVRQTNNIDRRLKQLERELKAIPRKAHGFFKNKTPIKTGNARRKTNFRSPGTISAEYNYANRLNEGWSRQATEGMTKPTIEEIRRLIRQI